MSPLDRAKWVALSAALLMIRAVVAVLPKRKRG